MTFFFTHHSACINSLSVYCISCKRSTVLLGKLFCWTLLLSTIKNGGIRNITLMTFLIRIIVAVTATKWETTHGINVTFYKFCISTGFTSYTFSGTVVERCLLELSLKLIYHFYYHCTYSKILYILFTHTHSYLTSESFADWVMDGLTTFSSMTLNVPFIHFSHGNGNHGTTQSLQHNWKGNETSQIIFSLSSKADVSWSQEHVG